MAVFRVERNKGYTVMSNYHLRDRNLSLKSKGLLSQMLSLPEDWDYTLKGLSSINKESIDAIRTAVWELEKAGYITRRQGRDEQGKMAAIEYTIYETPQRTAPGLENPTPDQPWLENPISENPTPENPIPENPTQLIKEELNKDLQSKDGSITESYPIPSCPDNYEDTALPERKRKDGKEAYQVYEEIIKDNIEFDWLIKAFPHDRDMLDEIVSLILETVSSRRKYLRIAGDDYPAELVKSKFMKLNSGHIEYVLDCMHQNTTKVRNIKKYMLAVLFNAPSTIGSYYTALVNHDVNEIVGLAAGEENTISEYAAAISEILNSVDVPKVKLPEELGFSTGEVNYYTLPNWGKLLCRCEVGKNASNAIFSFEDVNLTQQEIEQQLEICYERLKD